jgi:hypothetical protein
MLLVVEDLLFRFSPLSLTPLLLCCVRVQSSGRKDRHEHDLLFRADDSYEKRFSRFILDGVA